MFNQLDLWGHLSYLFIFTGMLLISAKDPRGWAARLIGELGWIVIGFVMGMSSIVLWGFAFMAVDVWGYLEWSSDKEILAMSEKPDDFEDHWDTSPDCDGKIHLPECRYFKPNEIIVYNPSRTIVKKVKKNGKHKKNVGTQRKRATRKTRVQKKVETRKPRQDG